VDLEEARKLKKQFSLATLRRMNPTIQDIISSCTHVVLYKYQSEKWVKLDVEGALFIVSCSKSPLHQMVVLNKNGIENTVINISKSLSIEESGEFLMYSDGRETSDTVLGLWFYKTEEKELILDCLNQLIASSQEWISIHAVVERPAVKDPPSKKDKKKERESKSNGNKKEKDKEKEREKQPQTNKGGSKEKQQHKEPVRSQSEVLRPHKNHHISPQLQPQLQQVEQQLPGNHAQSISLAQLRGLLEVPNPSASLPEEGSPSIVDAPPSSSSAVAGDHVWLGPRLLARLKEEMQGCVPTKAKIQENLIRLLSTDPEVQQAVLAEVAYHL
jgi:hypothetical protein